MRMCPRVWGEGPTGLKPPNNIYPRMRERIKMQNIYTGLKTGKGLAMSAYALFREYRDAYLKEWERLDENEALYQGDHWRNVKMKDANEPRPVTPILFSTVENLRADLADEYPEAIIKPEGIRDDLLAKVMTRMVQQTLESTDYANEYDQLTHDLLVGGYCVQEVGYDPTLHLGKGGTYIRHVPNKNILFDPLSADVQGGRAVFKLDRRPRAWLWQHYPEVAERTEEVETLVAGDHFDNGPVRSTDKNFVLVLEMWVRMFTGGRYEIHMVQMAGGQVLENSAIEHPDGYYAHGEYPFVVTPLYKIKGSPLGLGVVDMFKPAQLYSDKVDAIILRNAVTAGHNKLLVQEGSVDNLDELADYSKQIVRVTNPAGISWFQDRPLPSYMLNYLSGIRNSIKEESGSNDFSRGNVSAGVTAASAITALQEMSSKRSRKEARSMHTGFRACVRQNLEVERQYGSLGERRVDITVDGELKTVNIGEVVAEATKTGVPIEFDISIKPMRETRFTKMANNELVLQMMAMFQGQLQPAAALEMLDFDGKDVMLEKINAGVREQMEALAARAEEAEAMNQALMQENQQQKAAMLQAQELEALA